MNRRIIFFFFYMLVSTTYAQQAKDVFENDVYDAYEKAFNLNESKDFLGAYRHILLADKLVDETLSKKNLKAYNLSDESFIYPYWRIKQSKAEIAYMLGLHTDIKEISNELHHSLDEKKWDGNQSTLNGLLADLTKIDGSRYYLTEKYDSTEIALKNGLQLGSFLGNDDFVCKVHDDLAQLYYKQEKYDIALAHLDTILTSLRYQNDSRNNESEQNIKTAQSQRAICLARLGQYAEALKEIEPIVRFFKAANNKRLYAEALRKKAKILMSQYDATGKFSPEAISCYQQYLTISKDYVDNNFVNMSESEREQYWMAEQPFVTDCYRLEDYAPELLYNVALYSKAVLLQMGRDFKENMTVMEKKDALSSIRINWQQVRKELPASSCAIEFIVYEKKNQNHIGALVINKKSVTPKFIDMGTIADISNHILNIGVKVIDVLSDTQNKDKINALYTDSVLCRIIWNDEVIKLIGDCKNVFFSPDGIFHQLGIEYMIPQSIEKKRFYRLTTTRLLTQRKTKLQTDKMLVCGGVDYDFSEKDTETGNDELAYSLLSSMDVNVSPLPNSAVEIDSILSFRKKHLGDKVLRADSLTESALMQLMGKYHITHISTHGLFSEVAKIGTDIRPSYTDMQLSKNCLFLSGSQKNIRSQDFDASMHDGILSARELAKMNLNKVELAVLSACMSGLGYITPDGVYGLQRGLKTAGVKTIISTLWSVDDEASCFFIIQLYKNLETGQGVHKAFWTAREALKKYEKTYGNSSSGSSNIESSYAQRRRSISIPKFNKPYYYNAFILIDGF